MYHRFVSNPEPLSLLHVPDQLPFREEEYSRLLDNLRNSVHTVVWGPTGSGKTVLLRKASLHINSPKIRAICIDCSLYNTANTILREILIDKPIASRSNYDLLKRLMERTRNNRYAVCLDHVENLREKEVIGRLVKAGVCVVIACTSYEFLYSLDQVSHASIISSIELKAYSAKQVFHVLKSKVDQGLESGACSDETIQRIADKTKGNIAIALNILKAAALKAENQNKKSVDEVGLDEVLIENDCPEKLNTDEKLLLRILQGCKSLPSNKLHNSYIQGSMYPKSERAFRNYMESLCLKGLVKALGEKRGRTYEIIANDVNNFNRSK